MRSSIESNSYECHDVDVPRFVKKNRNRDAHTVDNPGARINSRLGANKQQIWKDFDSNQSYIINEGEQVKVQMDGSRQKKYYHYVTGKSNFPERKLKAEKTGDIMFAAQVPKHLNTNYEMLPVILAQL